MCFAFVFLILVQAVLHAVNLFDNLSNKLFPKYNSLLIDFCTKKVQDSTRTYRTTGRWTWVRREETQIETAVGGHQLQSGQAAVARTQV